jgi:AcrR family transcriptional regulator
MSHSPSASKGSVTREHILDRAYEMARRDGIEGLSLGSLAQGVGMSKSGVFAHFGSREDLQLAVLDVGRRRFSAQVFAPAMDKPRGLERLRFIVAAWFDWVRAAEGGCVLLTAVSEFDGRPGVLHEAVVSQQLEWRATLCKSIALAVDTGELRPDVDPGQFAFETYALVLGVHHDSGLFGYAQSASHAERAFNRLVDIYRSP